VSDLPAYAIVSPVKNEAERLELTLRSVCAQTHRPSQWVIFDDASSDGTRELAEAWAAREPWITVARRADPGSDGDRARGGRVVRAFERGRMHLRAPHELVAKLDGDIELPPTYFERVSRTFARDRRAGIVGGCILVPGRDGRWVPERIGRHTVAGAIKTYRVSCLEDIGGLRASMGWDGIDEYGAKARGWKVIPLADLVVRHHAPRGSKQHWWRARMEEGRGARYMGYLPSFVIVRSGYRMMVERPPVLGGLAILAGWSSATLAGMPRVDDPQAVQALRREQRARLRRLYAGGSVEPDSVDPQKPAESGFA
jgi:glycosyltransferase involved in cell wall biosynthesis